MEENNEVKKQNSCCQKSCDTGCPCGDANTCIALGTGVGIFGVGSALLTGATCPLCYVIAPALIGVGFLTKFFKRK